MHECGGTEEVFLQFVMNFLNQTEDCKDFISLVEKKVPHTFLNYNLYFFRKKEKRILFVFASTNLVFFRKLLMHP